MQTLEDFNSKQIENIQTSNTLTYYEQTYTDDLDPVKYIKPVNLEEANLMLDGFISTKWSKGDAFIIGFSKDNIHFWELSKNDQGDLFLLRIQNGFEYYQEEEKLDTESLKKSLEIFYIMQK